MGGGLPLFIILQISGAGCENPPGDVEKHIEEIHAYK